MLPNKSFKDTFTKDERIKMFKQHQEKHKGSFIAVVEREKNCKALPDLKHSKFSITADQKIMDVCDAIRKRIVAIDQKLTSQSLFIFTTKTLPNKESLVREIYESCKDPEDGMLYLQYSNVDPFGYKTIQQ